MSAARLDVVSDDQARAPRKTLDAFDERHVSIAEALSRGSDPVFHE